MLVAALIAGCGDNGSTCSERSENLTGSYVLTLTADGMNSIPRGTQMFAELLQVKPETFTLGRLVYGVISSPDKGFFDSLEIPPLMSNNGGKTGVVLGCQLQINVPVASPVSDDDNDPGALRLTLTGLIDGPRTIKGEPSESRVIMVDDPTAKPRRFAWTAEQQ